MIHRPTLQRLEDLANDAHVLSRILWEEDEEGDELEVPRFQRLQEISQELRHMLQQLQAQKGAS